ncbi:MAG: hypothetical protein SFX73_03835 [Kofleriaceae bacterium]|nr:hypothetical protein [Kofleriaceae bacterium]
MKKKLPVVKNTPASAQRDLAVKPVKSTSRPEFPTRSELARKAGMIGGATLLAGGLAHAQSAPAKSAPAMKPAPTAPAPAPTPVGEGAPKPATPPPPGKGSVDGKELGKTAPKFKVYREGGGIGPAEDMWNEEEVEAFINWTMAKEGKLNLKTNYAFELDGVKFNIDAFDPEKNVGYEYVDKLDYDSDYFTKEVRAKFDTWMKEKKVAILFIEVKKNPDAATLRGKVVKFLNAVKKSPPAPAPAAVAAPPTEGAEAAPTIPANADTKAAAPPPTAKPVAPAQTKK